MKFRVGLRTILFAIALIALGCGWYSSHAITRQKEINAIRQIEASGYTLASRFLYGSIAPMDLLEANINIIYADNTPSLMLPVANLLGIEAFHSVDTVVIKTQIDQDVVSQLGEFDSLTYVIYRPGPWDGQSNPDRESAKLLAEYAVRHRSVRVYVSEKLYRYLPTKTRGCLHLIE